MMAMSSAMSTRMMLTSLVSLALRYWATGGVWSCTTDVMTDGSKLVGVGKLKEQVETALTVRPILPRDRLELGTRLRVRR